MARKSKSQAQLFDVDEQGDEIKPSAPRMKMTTPCAWDGDTLVVNILGEPSAKRDAIGKTKGHQLKVSVTATPVAGRATDHMVKFLAEEFGVPAKAVTVVFGRFNVNKQLRIHAPSKIPAVLAKFLEDSGAT
ncbi:DUF167 family protein [Thiomonas sp. FB-Cd]|uniref:DUF167 domain-containing protein n=1 Tax=Thiomonas sp. FB-Cd TaxID=1158292 RepID=UPI000A9BA901|nr:DUF167 family protein [Thiomonas sp. FB-Cd]